ncbi:MAG: carboxyltransferase domain-containing protein, partial [Methylothermaceae bacterium]|nr:carboxyltransferase domain-containing protein [Methylothermaceae bacterium]
ATPLDPRHRLVTTKYNPARTWTPENAVGIGGAYLCVYGMEGPGGYQFVGRTLQVWNKWKQTPGFEPGKPWLLRFFDQIHFYPVSTEELRKIRKDFLRGRFQIRIEHESFSLREYRRFLRENAVGIDAAKARQQAAFDAERERWNASRPVFSEGHDEAPPSADTCLERGEISVSTPVPGSLWKLQVEPGDRVESGQTVAIVESMKMEIPVTSPAAGRIVRLLCAVGDQIQSGTDLMVLVKEK